VRARLLLFVLAIACGPRERSSDASTLPLADCHVQGATRPARCGVLERPEDPATPDGRKLSLRVVVIPAQSGAVQAPLYFMAGGPGQAASEAFAPLLPAFADLGEHRDLVLVDQRGTGSSNALKCKEDRRTLSERLATDLDTAKLRECLAGYDADTSKYLTPIAVDDLDAVRAALGHDRIDLYGGSYGTRAAMVYARQHPEHVGKLVLDGVAPVDMTMPLSFAKDAQAALDRTFADCAADPACAAAFPRASEAFAEWIDGLGPTGRTVAVTDPRTGAVEEVAVTRDLVALAIRGVLYSPDLAAMLPYVLHRAEKGDATPLFALNLALGDSLEETMASGMMLSVVCSEDVPFLADAAIARDSDGTFLGDAVVRVFRNACAVWRTTELPAGYRDPVRLDVPALVLSGELDPVTPPRWGEHVLPHLSAGRHLVVPGSGHGTTTQACVRDIMAAFLDDAEPDTACLQELRRPPFFVDFAGPPA